jgi:hypothetical protein
LEYKENLVIPECRRSPACGGESRQKEWSVGVVEIVQTVKIVKIKVASPSTGSGQVVNSQKERTLFMFFPPGF